jgi:hypothetical protein
MLHYQEYGKEEHRDHNKANETDEKYCSAQPLKAGEKYATSFAAFLRFRLLPNADTGTRTRQCENQYAGYER